VTLNLLKYLTPLTKYTKEDLKLVLEFAQSC